MQERTLYQMFQETARRYGARPAVGFRTGKSREITTWSYDDLAARVRALARGLDALGLVKGDRIALLMENRPEWAIVDLAAQALGLVTVTPYASLPAEQVAYIARDCSARAIVVSDAKQRAKVNAFRKETPALEFVIALDGEPENLEREGVLPFAAVSARGEAEGREEVALEALTAAVRPNDVATLIYTSGTTGEPKGAMLTHTNLLHTPDSVVEEPIADLGPEDVFLSFLPLSHITERVGGHYLPLRVGACIVYSQGLMALSDEIATIVRPTAMLCVPRLLEAMREKVVERLPKLPEREQRIAQWAIAVGEECIRRRSAGQGIGPLLAIHRLLAEKLVFAKLRARVTGGRLRYFVSGGAPLDAETAAFFLGIGVQLLEGYGLSEAGIIAVNRPHRQRIGTVGQKLPDVELKIAPDGEILMRGPGRMTGYFAKPEDTAEAIDAEGWFHTGDIGEMSPDGYLKITDRKKDIIVLTNGKKVAPQPIEAALKHSPYIAEAVLLGDKQSTVSAILVPNFERLRDWAKSQELPSGDSEALLAHPEVQKLYKGEVAEHTPGLADYEKVRQFRLASQPFSIETGELTPTLKVKRRFVVQKYADLIAAMSK